MLSERRSRVLRLSPLATLLLLLTSTGAPAEAQIEPPPCDPIVAFDRHNFPDTPRIDNPWLPLTPGTQLIMEGVADRGGGALPHRVIFTATDLTKVVRGVRTLVMWDLDISEGRIAEAELAFFAQDDAGNVWNLGEYPEEYEEATFLGAPSAWIAGRAEAEAGVHMQAVPQVSDREYLQGWAPEVDFLDCAKVVSMTERTCVPEGCYEPVLLTHERSPLDPEGGIQTKSHAQGVGIVEIGAIDDPEGETLVLVDRLTLGPSAMAQVRREVLRMDKRAYRVAFRVYGRTLPIESPRSAAVSRSGGGDLGGPRQGLKGAAAWCRRAFGPEVCRRWSGGTLVPGARALDRRR
jgi:hypothetical protein